MSVSAVLATELTREVVKQIPNVIGVVQHGLQGRSSGACSTTTRSNSAPPSTCGLIMIGNSGVGKSLLANVLLGREAFQHECSANSVTHETEFEDILIGNTNYAIFNIPGLIEADQARVDANKQEIYKAFQLRSNSIVVFIFNGGAGGRINSEDVIAFEAINKAYGFKRESLLFFVNDLPSKRPESYEGQTTIKLESLLQFKDIKICFLDRTDLQNEKAKQLLWSQMASKIIECTPREHIKKADIAMDLDKLKELKDEIKAQQTKFSEQLDLYKTQIEAKQKEFEQYKNQKPVEIHHYHERVVEQGGLCTLS